ncbi:unnamed protein product [Discula destructiva]
MSFSRLFVGSVAPKSLPRVPTDEVMPVHFFDDTPIFRNSTGCMLIRFNDVLDADKVHQSLATVATLPGGWRKLGGRIRINNNKLEIHVPKEFTPERPAVSYRHVSHMDMSIDEHPLASKLPKETPFPSLQARPEVTVDLVVDPKAPHCLDDYLKTDAPLIDLTIVSFKDATLINLILPHILGDALAVKALLEAWSLVLAGRTSEIPPNLSWQDDGLATAGLDPNFQEPHVLEHLKLKGPWLLMWIARYLLDMWWWPTMETRTLFLPASTMATLKRDATAALKDKDARSTPSNPDHAKPFVSTADVLFAWLCCMAVSVLLPRNSRRSVMLGFPCDIRDRAPSIFPKGRRGVHFQNAAPPLFTIVPARDLAADVDKAGKKKDDSNIVRVAQSIRHTIATQATEGQIHAAARVTRKSLADHGLPPIYGDMSQMPITTTNWTKADWFETLDLRPALVVCDKNKEAQFLERYGYHVPGMPAYFHMNEIHPVNAKKNNLARNVAYMVANPHGDYWVVGKFPPAVWDKIEADLQERCS